MFEQPEIGLERHRANARYHRLTINNSRQQRCGQTQRAMTNDVKITSVSVPQCSRDLAGPVLSKRVSRDGRPQFRHLQEQIHVTSMDDLRVLVKDDLRI